LASVGSFLLVQSDHHLAVYDVNGGQVSTGVDQSLTLKIKDLNRKIGRY
jgi:hypothetical protein